MPDDDVAKKKSLLCERGASHNLSDCSASASSGADGAKSLDAVELLGAGPRSSAFLVIAGSNAGEDFEKQQPFCSVQHAT